MAYTNCFVEGFSEVEMLLHAELKETELKFWKERARALEAKLRNIPLALKEYGKWTITIDGVTTVAVLAPAPSTGVE